MKLTTKLYITIGVLLCACLCLLVGTCNVNSRVDYHRGRADEALNDLKQAEVVFEKAIEQDATLQKEKDERIAELEVAIVKDDQKIVVIHESIVVTREMLISSGLYDGLVKELDEKWALKYATLEAKVVKKDKIIAEWVEKFDAKVKLETEGWAERDLKKQKALERVQKLCTAQEKQIKGLKFWGYIGKGFTAYHAVKGGIGLAKEIL